MIEKSKRISTFRSYGTMDETVCYASDRLEKIGVRPYDGPYDGTDVSIFGKALQQATRDNNEVAVYLNSGQIKGLFVVAPELASDNYDYVQSRFSNYVDNQKQFRFDKPIEEQKKEEEFDRFRSMEYKHKIFNQYGTYSIELCYADERLKKLGVQPYNGREKEDQKAIFDDASLQAKQTGKSVAVNFNGSLNGLFVLSPSKVNDYETFVKNQKKLRLDKPVEQQKIEEKMLSDSLIKVNE